MAKKSLLEKLWKSISSLAIAFGLLSITSVKIDLASWALIVIAVLFFALYWYFVEFLTETIQEIRKFFLNLQDDVKYIKKKIDEDKK